MHAHVNQTPGHEITHVVVDQEIDPDPKTELINEGLAVYFDQTERDRYAEARAALEKSESEEVSIQKL